jgi:hypothetical protein
VTGPIIFDPIGYPVLPNAADGADAFGDISAGVAADFAKVNQRLAASTSRFTVFSGKQAALATFDGGSDWVALLSEKFAPTTITLPGRVQAGLFISRGQVAAPSGSQYPSLNYTCDITGPGVAHPVPSRALLAISTLWGINEGSRFYLFLPGDLVASQSVTVTPMAAYNDVSGAYVVNGEWQLIVFSGDPP